VYANDASLPLRTLAETRYPRIVQWKEYDQGGHFAAMEVPDLFVQDLREFAAALHSSAIGRV
jgi:epoxide hydrolase